MYWLIIENSFFRHRSGWRFGNRRESRRESFDQFDRLILEAEQFITRLVRVIPNIKTSLPTFTSLRRAW